MERPLEKPPGSPARGTGPPPDPEYGPPTADATVYLYLEACGDQPGENIKSDGGRRTKKMRLRGRLTARFGLGIKVPAAESGHMLSTFEHVTTGLIWTGGVTGTLFGGEAAHLPPTGTLTVVVLEVLVPPVLFITRRRRRKDTPPEDTGH